MLSLQVRKLKDLYKHSLNTMASFTLSKKKLSKSLSSSAPRTNSASTSTIVFDIETNALKINDITKIHCCALNNGRETKLYKDPKEWIPILEEADVLVGHNIIQYDLVCIKHLFPEFKPKGHTVDTLILSRMFYPDILDIDYKHKWKSMPIQLYGRHKLEAYAHRLGMQKEHADLEDFSELTHELAQRCISDVDVTAKLWSRLQPKANSVPSAVDLEMRFADLISKQEQSGFHFDCKGAMELEAEIATQLKDIDERLRQRFPFVDGGLFTPKRNDSSRGYVAQATMCRLVPLNPNSRDHIAWVLKNHLKWKAETFTETGKPKIDESVLKDVPGAELFLTSLTLQKRLGQLSTGTNAWLRLVQSDNRIQAVAVRSTLGKEMRSLFGPNVLSTYTSPKGMVSKGGLSCPKQVGVDLSGIEARCLAHYLWPFDGGSFAKEVIEGDIHTANQLAAGLPTRDSAKTFFYALIYGVGAEKLSKITGMNGKKLKQTYYKNMPALAELTKRVTSKAEDEGILKALDGRPIKIRSPHSALNFLLQSAGAILSKAWYNICYDDLTKEGWVHGKDWAFLAHIHDEIQFSVKEEYAQQLADIATAASKKAGNQFKMRIDVESEYKIGSNWAECH
jgi:DNA polymerase I-like protein with 3'-5' exonuclease and polymerase domains